MVSRAAQSGGGGGLMGKVGGTAAGLLAGAGLGKAASMIPGQKVRARVRLLPLLEPVEPPACRMLTSS